MLLIFTKTDRYLFAEGKHCEIFKYFGAHLIFHNGIEGVRFVVWAPKAKAVYVTGDFNYWQDYTMKSIGNGLWEAFVENAKEGMCYKYKILKDDMTFNYKADPVGFFSELRPKTASIIYNLDGFNWTDDKWFEQQTASSYAKPINIYEVHLGSWKKRADGSFLSYKELAEVLPKYVKKMGYTHIEIMPLTEHPLDNSWGYQTVGYFATTSRYGTPHDFMFFINKCHEIGLGVIMDWAPGHFCKDDIGLREFDGTFCYEPEHPLRRYNDGWGTSYFDFGKPEIRSFLISNAIFWLEIFHLDGLRVDAVASMLYLDYTKEKGQWLPNEYGGRENNDAINFIKDLNTIVFSRNPKALMMAEESTSYPLVTWPVYEGGLGFNYKWNMGWMNDVLSYMKKPTVHRKHYHNKLTFSFMYAFSENFVLPFSHDEVVHGKKTLVDKMPGDYWQKFANLRLLLAYMIAHPGKKLLFMGQEIAHFLEWDENREVDWFLLNYDMHQSFKEYVRMLNIFYLKEPCFWEIDNDWTGFRWLDADDREHSVISFLRFDKNGRYIVVACNFTEIPNKGYRLGVPNLGAHTELFNSDEIIFGGTTESKRQTLIANPTPWHDQKYSLTIDLPPLSAVFISFSHDEKGCMNG